MGPAPGGRVGESPVTYKSLIFRRSRAQKKRAVCRNSRMIFALVESALQGFTLANPCVGWLAAHYRM
jgi:hypothetical protein